MATGPSPKRSPLEEAEPPVAEGGTAGAGEEACIRGGQLWKNLGSERGSEARTEAEAAPLETRTRCFSFVWLLYAELCPIRGLDRGRFLSGGSDITGRVPTGQ